MQLRTPHTHVRLLAVLQLVMFVTVPLSSIAWDDKDRQELINCINDNQSPLNVTTWSAVMNELPTAVRVAEIWWSKRPTRTALTITTGLSYDRLDQLLSMCRVWPGPISAVVHLSVLAPTKGAHAGRAQQRLRTQSAARAPIRGAHRLPMALANATSGPAANTTSSPPPERALRPDLDPLVAQAVAHASLFHRMVDLAPDTTPCQLDLMLVYEVFDSAMSKALYPYNIIRNYARLQARTPLIALLDIDMLPSRQLFETLASHDVLAELQTYAQRKHVMVLPAFKTNGGLMQWDVRHLHPGQIIADVVAREDGKAQLAARLLDGQVEVFDASHAPTLYDRWFGTQHFYWIDYPSDPRKGFEPWGIVDRRLPPFTDVRFRGYGMDKIVIMAHLRAMGFTYMVHPHAFIIHRPHHSSSGASMYWKGHKVVHKFYEAKIKYELNQSSYMPRLSEFIRDPETHVYVHAHRVGDMVMSALTAGNYTVVLDRATAVCRQQLPWWREEASAGDRRL